MKRWATIHQEAVVPEEKLEKMLSILEPPMPWEARTVEWITEEAERSDET